MKSNELQTINTSSNDLKPNKSSSALPVHKPSEGVDISFKDLVYGVQIGSKHLPILKGLSGSCKTGSVTAILGASGGGKTSLLNVLSGKIKKTSKITLSGDVRANGKNFTNDQFNQFSAYVMQNDILLETMTARECIQFAADLKLSGTEEFKRQRVNEVIDILKLNKCQNALIGGQLVKGISGGERKRVNIGCELITDPSVIFLDEPTSGLDSFTAYIVIHALKEFAVKQNKTVIMSIHSPNMDIWDLFDNVILLVHGSMIYQGERSHAVEYFKQQGLECPRNKCPADFLMDFMTYSPDNEKLWPVFYENYTKHLLQPNLDRIAAIPEQPIPLHKFSTTFLYQMKKVAVRSYYGLVRNPMMFRSRLIQTFIVAVFIGLVFLQQDPISSNSSQTEVSNKAGVLFLTCMSNLMTSLNGILLSFPAERQVFLKEENSKYYSTLSYLLGRLSLEFIQISIYPIIKSTIIYFMVGLNTDSAVRYFYFLMINVLLSWVGNALGLTCGTLLTNPRTASALQPVFKLPFVLFSGFFKNRNDYASWIGWLTYVSPFTYALEGLVRNEITGQSTPFDIIDYYGFNIGMWYSLLILFLIFLAFQVVAAISLYMKRGTLQ